MRFYTLCLLALFSALFCACGGAIATLDGEDATLPIIKNVKTISDVGAIAFEWEKIDDERVSGIAIYKEKNGEFTQIAHLKNAQITHFVDEKLTPETNYRYKFKTLSPTHYSKDSKIVTAKTSYIKAVERIFASNDYAGQIKIIFSPHQNPSIAYYLVQREVDGVFKTIALVNHRLLSEYFDTNLEAGKSYKYRIVAVDYAKNPSRPSKIVTAKTKNPPPPPNNLTASQNLVGKIALAWEAQTNASEYHIYRANAMDGNFSRIATTPNNHHSDIIGKNGVSFFYKILSIDKNALKSAPSNAVQGKTKSPPQAPKITRGFVDNNEAKIEWSVESSVESGVESNAKSGVESNTKVAESGVESNAKIAESGVESTAKNPLDSAKSAHFVVYRVDSASGKQTRFKATQNYFHDKEVGNGGEFRYYVVAVDESGLESAHSNEIILSIK